MRTLSWGLAGMMAMLATACSGGSQSALAPAAAPPELPTGSAVPQASAALGHVYQSGAIHESALAIYTLDLDPAALTATARLKETRQGQANDDLYLLSIDNFLRADSFRITSVARSGGDLELGYAVEHPFPAPIDPAGAPNGFTNRSDLGIAGMVLFLADVPSASGNTYFTDRIANTGMVTNADAYYSPADLLSISGTANTYPYRQLVDESLDPRRGVSNGGNPKGNFGADGWTRAKYGPGNNGWTGYGVLHQGQMASNTVAFDLAALGSGLSLDVAIIAKYNDPRGGATAAQKRANRLPGATADHTQFAYRMPHGALDVASIRFAGDNGPGFLDTRISGTELEIQVIDWDANGTPSGQPAGELENDPVVTNIEAAEAGSPTVEVCIPDVLGDATVTAAVAEDGASGEGIPGDPLIYRDTVTKTAVSGIGTFTGMIRATDPEDGAPLYIPLDQGNPPLPLGPSTTKPRPVTYQAFSVEVFSANTPPTATVVLTSSDPLLSATAPSVSITGITDPEGDALDIEVDWGDGNGFQSVVSGMTPPYTNQSPAGPVMNNSTLSLQARPAVVRLFDGMDTTDYPVPFDLGPNRPPQVTGTPALASAVVGSPAYFTMNAGTATATDPEGDTISYTIVNNRNANVMTFPAFPNAANTTAITNPPHTDVTFTIYANDPLHPTTGGTAYPTVMGTVGPPDPNAGWVYTPLVSGTGLEVGHAVVVDATGHIYAAGQRAASQTVDFGGGPRGPLTGQCVWLLKLDPQGNYVWDRVWNTTTSTLGRVIALQLDAAGNVYIYGNYANTLLIAGLGGIATNMSATGSLTTGELYLLKFDPAGTLLAQWTSVAPDPVNFQNLVSISSNWTASYGPSTAALAINQTDGSLYITCTPTGTGTADFGSGVSFPTLGGNDAILVKLNSSLVPQWGINLAAAGGGANSQYGISVALNPLTGNPYVSGSFLTSIDLGAGPVAPIGGQDAFLASYSAVDGSYAGFQRILGSSGTGNEQICGLVTDNTHVYVSGHWASGVGQTMSLGAPLGNMTAVATTDAFVGAYTHGNVPVWQRHFSGTNNILAGNLALHGGNIYISGQYTGTNPNWGYGLLPASGSTAFADAALSKLSAADGALTGWAIAWGINGSVDDYGSALAVAPTGHPIVTGRWGATGSNLNFDPGGSPTGMKTSTGGGDVYILKLRDTGVF